MPIGRVTCGFPAVADCDGAFGKFYGASGARSGVQVTPGQSWHRSHGPARERRNMRRSIGQLQNFALQAQSEQNVQKANLEALSQWSADASRTVNKMGENIEKTQTSNKMMVDAASKLVSMIGFIYHELMVMNHHN